MINIAATNTMLLTFNKNRIQKLTSRRSNRKIETLVQGGATVADNLAIWHGNVDPEERRAVDVGAFKDNGQEVRSKFVQT